MDTRSKQKYLSKKNQASTYFETFIKKTNCVNSTDSLYLKVTRKGTISMAMHHIKNKKAHDHTANGDANIKDNKVVRDDKAKSGFHAHNASCSIRLENGVATFGLQMVRLLLRKGDGLDVVNESFQFIPTHFNFNEQVHDENEVFEDVSEIVIDQHNASTNNLAKLIGKSYLLLSMVEFTAEIKSRQKLMCEALKDALASFELNEKDIFTDDDANHLAKEEVDKGIANNEANGKTNDNGDTTANDDDDDGSNNEEDDHECEFETNALNDHGQTHLGIVAHCGQLFLAQFLIENGADVNQPNDEGKTPLHIAVKSNKLQMVRLLLDYGADLFANDNEYMTAMHYAITYGLKDIVEMMFEKINPQASNEIIRHFLNHAIRVKQIEIVQILLQYDRINDGLKEELHHVLKMFENY